MISKKTLRLFSTQTPNTQFDAFMEYARSDLIFKYGNNAEADSRFNFMQRWYLERKLLNYNHQKHSMFLYAYRAFLDAMN
jgi:hypothetical protein